MTRNEVFEKCKKIGMIDSFTLVSCLEALGLIKFKEEKPIDPQGALMQIMGAVGAKEAIETLEKNGFKIVNQNYNKTNFDELMEVERLKDVGLTLQLLRNLDEMGYEVIKK